MCRIPTSRPPLQYPNGIRECLRSDCRCRICSTPWCTKHSRESFNFYPKKKWQARHITQHNIGVDGDLSFKLNDTTTAIFVFTPGPVLRINLTSLGAFNRFLLSFLSLSILTNLYTPDTEPLPVGGIFKLGYNAEFTSGPPTPRRSWRECRSFLKEIL